MTHFLFHCHPADLEAEGPDAAFSRLRGEIGVDGVVIDAIARSRLALRPRLTDAPLIASHEAAAWFQPEAKHYANTRLRPNPVKAIKSRNAFARLCESAAVQGLTVRARIDPLDNATLVERHPTAACVDVFGRPHDSRLCPSNPNVREFVASVAEDLAANYPLAAIELLGLHFEKDLYTDQVANAFYDKRGLDHGLPGGYLAACLLGLCFCSSCRHAALERDVDPEKEANEIKGMFSELAGMRVQSIREFTLKVNAHGAVSAYPKVQTFTAASLWQVVRRRSRAPVWVPSTMDGYVTWFEVADLDGKCVASAMDYYGLHETGFELYCHPPQTSEAQRLVSAVRDFARKQYGYITFSEYGLAPELCLDWVRQAIRFARREST